MSIATISISRSGRRSGPRSASPFAGTISYATQNQLPTHLSPRCNAFAHRTKKPCQNGAMPNGMHDGATPRGARHGAFVYGEHTIETIADGRKAAALNDTATPLVADNFVLRNPSSAACIGLFRPIDRERLAPPSELKRPFKAKAASLIVPILVHSLPQSRTLEGRRRNRSRFPELKVGQISVRCRPCSLP